MRWVIYLAIGAIIGLAYNALVNTIWAIAGW